MQCRMMIAAVLATVGLMGCAQTQVEKDLDREATAEPARRMHGGVATKGYEAIENSRSLSPEQKQQLKELHGQMIAKTFTIQEDTAKLKGVLFNTLTKSPYDEQKVETIKKRLVALNEQKMQNMFSALSQAQKILGVTPPEERMRLFDDMFLDRHVADTEK